MISYNYEKIYKDPSHFIQNITVRDSLLLSVDVGTKKFGVAVCDPMWSIVSPLEVIQKREIARLNKIISNYQPKAIVIGWPLEPGGIEGKSCERVIEFINTYLKSFDLPIFLQDETLSTRYARDMISERAMNAKQMDNIDDKLAASIILEDAISKFVNIG